MAKMRHYVNLQNQQCKSVKGKRQISDLQKVRKKEHCHNAMQILESDKLNLLGITTLLLRNKK